MLVSRTSEREQEEAAGIQAEEEAELERIRLKEEAAKAERVRLEEDAAAAEA